MPEDMKDVTITLSFADFQDLSTDAAAELCARLGDIRFAEFSALLLACVARKLFTKEELIVEEEE